MAEFNSHIITNAGRNLLARALAGEGKVIFTKAAFGDQKHSGNLREVTELKNKKLDLNVMNIRNDNGTAVLTVQISNQNVDQSFQTEEFGVYAKIENDVSEVLYSYTTAISADTFPNNRLGKTYESIQDIYMAISSDVEAEIYVRDGVIYLTRDIANQVYTETGIIAVGTLKGRSNLEENKQYLADNGHWYKNIGGNRSWNSLGTPDEQLIPITWEYLYKSLNTKEGQLIQNLNGLLGKNNGQFPVDQAVEGNVYYFSANQKYYYCLKSQSGRTSVPNADFEEMSIWANKKKLENLNTSDYKILLDKSYISDKNIFTTDEIIWGVSELAEYKKAIKNYPFIVIQFFSSHTSIISSLFKSDNNRLFVPIPKPESEHTIFQIVESDNSFKVFRTYNFGNIKCTGLRIMGVKIF
nr:MAG TPA: tail collar fiber protein [Caudoviricetes sp.]